MPTANDFRTIRVQASIFTPELQFRAAKVLAYLLTEYGDEFDGAPLSMPHFPVPNEAIPQFVFEAIPQVILKSADDKLVLNANQSRLDILRSGEDISAQQAIDHLAWASNLFLKYLAKNSGRAGRVACITHRAAAVTDPGLSLARHFCQPQWLNEPLNRPENFEIHAHKRFRLPDLFEVNSWFRCKTAIKAGDEKDGRSIPNMILVEQDLNSLAEAGDARELSDSEIRRFFEGAPEEMRHILSLYFPTAE